MPLNCKTYDYRCPCGVLFDGYSCQDCWFHNDTNLELIDEWEELRFWQEREENVVSIWRILSRDEGCEWEITFDVTDAWHNFSVTIKYKIILDTSGASSSDNTVIIKRIDYDFIEGTPPSHKKIFEESNFDVDWTIRNACNKD
jgi:hypothetical protein